MPGIGFVQHNLCQEKVLSDITNAGMRYSPTEPMPGIGFVQYNLPTKASYET